VLVVLTNNAWFGEGGAAYQHAAHSVLRAVETRRPVMRAATAAGAAGSTSSAASGLVLKDEAGSVYFRGAETVTVTRDARWNRAGGGGAGRAFTRARRLVSPKSGQPTSA
jgi:apolipoprotein N-acyltransferase